MEKKSIDKLSEESIDTTDDLANQQQENIEEEETFKNLSDPEKVIQLSLNRNKSRRYFQWKQKLDKFKYKNREQEKKQESQFIKSEANQYNFSDIWLLTSHVSYLLTSVYQNYYKDLLEYKEYPDYFQDPIQKDLIRTYANSQNYIDNGKKMHTVLTMYARRNPYIGYCQGMNFLVYQIMSLNYSEEESFWLLAQLIETILPIDYYTTMVGVICDIKIFQQLLKYYNPNIYKKFQEIQLDVSLFTVQWFVCAYSNIFQPKISLIVWDHLFSNGSITLFKVGLILLDYCEKKLLQIKEFPQAILIVEDVAKNINDEFEFNSRISKLYISKKAIKYAQDLYRNEHQHQFKRDRSKSKVRNTKKKSRKEQDVNCNVKWPICHKLLNQQIISKKDMPYFIFRQSKHIQINKDYFNKFDKIIEHHHDMSSNRRNILLQDDIDQISLDKIKFDFYQELVIGRMDHNCDLIAYKEFSKFRPKEEFLEMKEYNSIEIEYSEVENKDKSQCNKKQFTSFAQQIQVFDTTHRKFSQQQVENKDKLDNIFEESKQEQNENKKLNIKCQRSQTMSTLQNLKKSLIIKPKEDQQKLDESIFNKYKDELENTTSIQFLNQLQESKIQFSNYLSGQNNIDDDSSDNDDINALEQ